MDLFIVKAIVSELEKLLLNARIIRISQPTMHDLVFSLKSSSECYHLLISISPRFSRIHLLEVPPENPPTPGTFYLYARKHLAGADIISIDQMEMERVVIMKLGKRDALGRTRNYSLIAEIMGRHSNIILVDYPEGRILESMKRVDASLSTVRPILPGLIYEAPPSQKKIHRDKLTLPQFLDLIKDVKEIDARWLVSTFSSFNKLLAEETIHRWKSSEGNDSLISLWQIIKAFDELYAGKSCEFTIYLDSMKKYRILSAYPLHHLDSFERRVFKSINQAADIYYSQVITEANLVEKLSSLRSVVCRSLDKEKKKNEAILQDLKRAENRETSRLKGDLILAHLNQIKKGMKLVSLPDLFSPDLQNIEVELNPRLSPVLNAQRYYKESVKARKSQEIAKKRWETVKNTMAYLEQVLYCLDEVKNLEEIEPVRLELEQQGYWKKNRVGGKESKKAVKVAKPSSLAASSSSIRHFKLDHGYEIFVGKNNRGNDYLISRIASKDDLWLHARGMPGSHVIIKSHEGNTDIDMEILQVAARLAAYYSRGRSSGTVEVDYTKIKYVKKIKGGSPGLVSYDHQKTIRVPPEPIFNQ